MDLLRTALSVASLVGLLFKAVFALVFVGIAWVAVGQLVGQGELPAEPLGLAAAGLPGTVLGIPTAYAAGLVLLGLLILFGDGSTSGDGDFDGGFGGDGGGGGE
ncbi:hypothetical protein BRD00_04110 [Halobacteriales archaeon QS_8_69_26]|nr:MAG: hypothetical protein BRD00_04110 [Halobacteriales archaeon QS_8_69_26]